MLWVPGPGLRRGGLLRPASVSEVTGALRPAVHTPSWIRTSDLCRRRAALFPLSYRRVLRRIRLSRNEKGRPMRVALVRSRRVSEQGRSGEDGPPDEVGVAVVAQSFGHA